jgi:SAM-dependent methyltransferase
VAIATCEAEATYEAFAPHYDEFTGEHRYEWWLGELLGVLERHGLEGDRLLDVGCGTGKAFVPMIERGWKITGCDISRAMLERARAKVGEGVRLSVADMRELPDFGEFDLVWALYDALNYLLNGEELQEALGGMATNVASGGLLTFDVLTLQGCRTFFTGEHGMERDGRRMTWHGEGSSDAASGVICEATFEVEAENGAVARHRHRQRHYPEDEMRAALESAGLECIAVYGMTTDGVLRQPLNESTYTKAQYIARLV